VSDLGLGRKILRSATVFCDNIIQGCLLERVEMSVKKEKMLVREGLLESELVFGIDKNLLDDEWLNQPKLYFNWAVQLEDARAELDSIKAEFDVVQADLDLDIRANPDKYGELPKDAVEKGKITEKMVAASLVMQPEYKNAQQAVFTAKHRVGVLQAAVNALDHRKRALEKLVDLHGQKYFATPRASEDSRDAMGEVERRSVRNRIRASGKKKR